MLPLSVSSSASSEPSRLRVGVAAGGAKDRREIEQLEFIRIRGCRSILRVLADVRGVERTHAQDCRVGAVEHRERIAASGAKDGIHLPSALPRVLTAER